MKEAMVETLITEFKNMKIPDNDSIHAYAAKLSALEQVLDLKTTGFEDVVGRLKANEERVKEEDKANDAQENLLYDRTEYSNGNNDSSQGRGRGSYSRGRGHGRSQCSGCDNTQNHGQCDSLKNRKDNKQNGKQRKKRDLSHIKCYHCDEYGHFVSRCSERNRNNEVNINETQEKNVYHEKCMFFLMNHIQETIFMNEENYTPPKSESNINKDDVWYFDNGASNHITATKGRKIHHLDVKTDFLYGDRKKLDSTLHEMGFLQCVHEKAVYRKVPNGEFIILVIYGDDLFVTGASLDLINELQKRMASQFEISELGELTYYLGIKVSQGKDCVEIKQEIYAMKILKEGGMEDCIATLCLMELRLKFSKAKEEPEVEATQYRNIGTTSFGIKYKRGNDMKSVRYSSHNVDIDDGWSTIRHIFSLGTSPITWCSQRQTTVALSSCEAEFMETTATACQAIWLREVLAEVIRNEHVIVEQVSEGNQREDPLMKVLARIRFKEMTLLLSVQESPSLTQKFKG
nr:hypothetical protein [Tanacetum cinerariifolium]